MSPTVHRHSLAVFLSLIGAAAQSQQVAPTVLQLPAGARALALGDVFIAGRGSDVMFYNPAMLALVPGLSASVQRYGAASTLGSVSSVFSAGPIAAGIGAQLLDYGAESPGATRSTLATLSARGSVPSASTATTLAIASQFKGVRLGVATKYVEERVGLARDGGAAFDVGAGRDFFGRATLGLVAQNLGAPLQVNGMKLDLPMKATLGAAVVSPPLRTFFDLAATAAVTYRRDGKWIPAGGVELNYVPLDGWVLTGRAGARRTAGEFGARPLTLGAGVSFDRVSLDYAFQSFEGPEAAHRVGLRLR